MRLTSDKKIDHRTRGVKTWQLMLDGTAPAPVEKGKSYTREEKLKVVKFYFDKGNNIFQTSKNILSEHEEHLTTDLSHFNSIS